MQYGLNDIRQLGYLKIMHNFIEKNNGEGCLFESLAKVNGKLAKHKVTPFGFIQGWNDLHTEYIQSFYGGMVSFVASVEPMIANIEVDETCKRRFRNMWNSMWKSFSSSVNCEESNLALIKELGLRLVYSDDTEKVPSWVLDFFNSIIYWTLATQSTLSLSEIGYTPWGAIEMLATCSDSSFVNMLTA